ncbi:MAG TPA: hypothetical protein VFI68_02015 [Anaerolineales bacterium]|nr:hypothetical protein [Anaerolineales bacterium]
MKRKRKLIITVILTATAGFFLLQNGNMPSSDNPTQTPTITVTPTSTAIFENCAYVWAHHDAPELKKKLVAEVNALNPKARANVSLFGEDCVYSDGHSTFGVMETDFYIYLTVEDLTTEEIFGNWMAQVLPIIVQFPREEIQGNYGFVEFWFETEDNDHLIVRVPMQQYIAESQGKTGLDLFRLYHDSP